MFRYAPSRAMILIGVLLIALVAVHYWMDFACLNDPRCRLPAHTATRFACLCPLSGLLVGLAMVLQNRKLATYGVILWLMFPLGATLHQYFLGPRFGFEWPLAYQLVLLIAGPMCLVSGLMDRWHAMLAFGVSWLGFFAKGLLNHLLSDPELQIWFVALSGMQVMHDNFLTINLIGLAIGVVCTALGVMILRRRKS